MTLFVAREKDSWSMKRDDKQDYRWWYRGRDTCVSFVVDRAREEQVAHRLVGRTYIRSHLEVNALSHTSTVQPDRFWPTILGRNPSPQFALS